ncbi:hypothetical protein A4H97_17990 [Niastella yeongjuensis]|uniref:Uncharacterized protein n=1 Tax=Niastella yeongjuensis TaxID=354355 RepID=A0A1V9DXL8_9BACT|nr:hypothetical protein [Niastella yeongjuensis]OQP38616.1 hypothetical protein A4H97_17990 [Niastella yeongjuensis]SEO39408.1 hypothetical protein SAMN05660816_02805 [Niastella yeongjuensis]
MPDTLQTIISRIDISNFSGEISGIIKGEIRKKGLGKGEVGKGLKQLLQNADDRKKYLHQYEEQLNNTFASLLPKEIILQVNKTNLSEYINDGFRKFTVSTGGKYVDKVLAPALATSINDYAVNSLKEYLDSKKNDLNELVNASLSYLSKQGVKVKEIGEVELAKKLSQIKAQLPGYNLSDALINEVINQANNLIKNNPNEIIISLEGDVKKRFSQKFLNVRQEAEAAAKKSFKELGDSVKKLTENEGVVNDVIDKFKNDVGKREQQIKELEGEINDFLKNGTVDLHALGQKQIEHARLIAENLFHINCLNNYIKQGIKFIDSIDSYKDKAGKIFSGEYLNDFKNKLEELKKPTFSSVVHFATETLAGLDAISGAMEKFGVFKNAAKSVGKFVGYTKIAIGIATSLMPPNPIGIIGALGSLGGLFGGGGPSLEEQMFEEMQKGFNQLNERLDQIEMKIDKLAEMIQESYKNIMQSLQLISNQLKNIAEQLDLNTQMLDYLIYNQYNLVEVVIEGKEQFKELTGLELYRRWYAAYQLTIDALKELLGITSSSKNLQNVIRQDFLIPGLQGKKFKDLAFFESQSYKNSLALFKNIFPKITNDTKTKNLLLLPPQKNKFNTYQQGYDLSLDKATYNFDTATENYFNAYFIAKLVQQYIELQPFFILSKNNQFEPYSTYDELIVHQSDIKDKLGSSKGSLTNLLDAVNYSIIQQSILAGTVMIPFINNALYGNDDSNYQLTIEALKTNELLGKNLAAYFINTKIDKGDLNVFSYLYYEVNNNHTKLNDLNTLLKYGQGKLEFGFDDLNPANPILCLFFKRSPAAEKIRLPVPDLTIIEEGQMLQTSALSSLLEAKEKIITALIDIGFFQKLSTDQQSIYKEVFFFQS